MTMLELIDERVGALFSRLHGAKLDGPRNEIERELLYIRQLCGDALNGKTTCYCKSCGGESQLVCHDKSAEPGREGYSVDCEDCPNATMIFTTEKAAEAAWNLNNPQGEGAQTSSLSEPRIIPLTPEDVVAMGADETASISKAALAECRNKTLLEAAAEVESHWNHFATMTNQKDQAKRSADVLRTMAGAPWPKK